MAGYRRRWLFATAVVVLALLVVFGAVSGFYVDVLWFRELHFSSVFWTVFWSKVALGVLFGTLFFVLLVTNLWIARRLAPRFRPFSQEQEMIDRYRAAFEPYARWALPAFAVFISMIVGIVASGHWETFLLWRSAAGVRFGAARLDPVFHRDPSFYIFTLPFVKYVHGWLFSSLVGITIISGLAHYMTGGIRTQTAGEKATPGVRAHVSVLLGLIVLTKAWGYYLGRFDLLVSERGAVTGASYTDIHVQKPAFAILIAAALFVAVLFFVNVRFRVWALPVLGIVLLAVVSIVAGAIVPAAVQRFSVTPQEYQREEPFIARNIAATRFAFGLDRIDIREQSDVATDISRADVERNESTVANIRLWNPGILRTAYDQLQRFQPYYDFSDVDVDRYDIEGDRRLVMLAPREISREGFQSGSWQNVHLFFTHGYGAVASRVNGISADGGPDFVLSGVPPAADSGIQFGTDEGAQIYFGELTDDPAYVVVGGDGQTELNYPTPTGGDVTTAYRGNGGIPIGGFFRRLVFGYRFRDVNIVISGLIDSESRILINRDIRTRVRKAAPFLEFDGDPYAAIVDGRLHYIWDAYTTTDRYPYSEPLDLERVTGGQMLGRANYIRNSVKVVVDAYNGTVRFYVVDPSDPLIRVWMNAFPDLFTRTPPSLALQSHFRYPENLLQIQAEHFGNYHVTNTGLFFRGVRPWAVPRALAESPNKGTTGAAMRPYYVLLKLPDQPQEQFVLFMPMTPAKRPNMVAYLAALSDPGAYPGIVGFELPAGASNVDGPQQVRARINQDPVVSQTITLLSQQGSEVKYGDLLVVPLEASFIYVQPIFVESAQENAIPELKRVVVVHGQTVTMGNTLPDAIAQSFGGKEAPPQQPGGQGPGPSKTVSQLLAEAVQHFDAAEEALLAGDLATYQRETELGEELVRRASELAAKESGATPSPGATPTTSVSPGG